MNARPTPPGRPLRPGRPDPSRVPPERQRSGPPQVVRPVRPQAPTRQPTRPPQPRQPTGSSTQTYVSAGRRTMGAGPVVTLADRRGLTAAGGVVLSLLIGLVGATVDVLTGSGLRSGFAIAFVVACLLTALLVHREDLRASVVMPPLVYVTLSLGIGAVARTAGTGSFVLQQAVELVNAVVLGAPVLLLGTAVAALVAIARWMGSRG